MAQRPAVDAKTLTRNWNELLQELRVTQTGVQILTGFLLTVPFSSRFTDLNDRQVTIYLAVLSGAAITTALVTAPVAFHRTLFRRGERRWLVEAANNTARAGLTTMTLTVSGVLLLVFDIVVGPVAGIVAIVITVAFFAGIWWVLPWWRHRGQARGARTEAPTKDPPSDPVDP